MCYMILAGKKACEGSAIFAGHNNDLQGNQGSLYELLPEGREEQKISLPSGASIVLPPNTLACLILKTWRGYMEGDAVAINQDLVAIAGGVDLGVDRNRQAELADPLISDGVSGAVRYIALEQAHTARECVQLIGNYYNQYGISYPSGVGVVDANEAWYMEAGGGSCWAAVRVPDECYMVQANGFRIGEVDPDDKEHFLCSPDLLKFAEQKKLWSPKEGPFNFSVAFGGKMLRQAHTMRFNPRRVWGCMRHLNPSLHLDPQVERHPLFLEPERKISVSVLKALLRDQFDDTEYQAFPKSGGYGADRPVCVPSCVHSAIIELNSHLPVGAGGIIWGSLASPSTSPYVPCYLGGQDLPEEFKVSSPTYDAGSAFWHFRSLSNLSMVNPQELVPVIQAQWKLFEDRIQREHFDLLKKIEPLQQDNGHERLRMLSSSTQNFFDESLVKCKEIEGFLQTEIAKDIHRIFSVSELSW